MVAFLADKVDFLYTWMKVVSESIIFNDMWKALRPTQKSSRAHRLRNTVVDKFCDPFILNLINKQFCNFLLVYIILINYSFPCSGDCGPSLAVLQCKLNP